MGLDVRSPVKLETTHVLETFDCGDEDLNRWLQRQATKSELGGTARTYVVCDRDNHVVAYYCVASGSVVRNEGPGSVSRNMPDPIPVMVIGRLTVDWKYQNQKLGAALLKDALLRVVQASEIVGIRAVLVHAISEKAKAFYMKHGFQESPGHPMTLMISLARVKSILEG
jgi:GNAT superfamily N-acetyltransferase